MGRSRTFLDDLPSPAAIERRLADLERQRAALRVLLRAARAKADKRQVSGNKTTNRTA